jgi:hypothetical protein
MNQNPWLIVQRLPSPHQTPLGLDPPPCRVMSVAEEHSSPGEPLVQWEVSPDASTTRGRVDHSPIPTPTSRQTPSETPVWKRLGFPPWEPSTGTPIVPSRRPPAPRDAPTDLGGHRSLNPAAPARKPEMTLDELAGSPIPLFDDGMVGSTSRPSSRANPPSQQYRTVKAAVPTLHGASSHPVLREDDTASFLHSSTRASSIAPSLGGKSQAHLTVDTVRHAVAQDGNRIKAAGGRPGQRAPVSSAWARSQDMPRLTSGRRPVGSQEAPAGRSVVAAAARRVAGNQQQVPFDVESKRRSRSIEPLRPEVHPIGAPHRASRRGRRHSTGGNVGGAWLYAPSERRMSVADAGVVWASHLREDEDTQDSPHKPHWVPPTQGVPQRYSSSPAVRRVRAAAGDESVVMSNLARWRSTSVDASAGKVTEEMVGGGGDPIQPRLSKAFLRDQDLPESLRDKGLFGPDQGAPESHARRFHPHELEGGVAEYMQSPDPWKVLRTKASPPTAQHGAVLQDGAGRRHFVPNDEWDKEDGESKDDGAGRRHFAPRDEWKEALLAPAGEEEPKPSPHGPVTIVSAPMSRQLRKVGIASPVSFRRPPQAALSNAADLLSSNPTLRDGVTGKPERGESPLIPSLREDTGPPPGAVTDRLTHLRAQVRARLPVNHGAARVVLNRQMRRQDMDGDSRLSAGELGAALSAAGAPLSTQDLQLLCVAFDAHLTAAAPTGVRDGIEVAKERAGIHEPGSSMGRSVSGGVPASPHPLMTYSGSVDVDDIVQWITSASGGHGVRGWAGCGAARTTQRMASDGSDFPREVSDLLNSPVTGKRRPIVGDWLHESAADPSGPDPDRSAAIESALVLARADQANTEPVVVPEVAAGLPSIPRSHPDYPVQPQQHRRATPRRSSSVHRAPPPPPSQDPLPRRSSSAPRRGGRAGWSTRNSSSGIWSSLVTTTAQ